VGEMTPSTAVSSKQKQRQESLVRAGIYVAGKEDMDLVAKKRLWKGRGIGPPASAAGEKARNEGESGNRGGL